MKIVNKLYITKAHLLVCLLFLFVVSCKTDKKEEETLQPITSLQTLQNNYKANLLNCATYLDSTANATTKQSAINYYKNARLYFKKIEPILAFADKENYKAVNAPNILKVEEEDATNIKIKEPFGFQVIEETIFEEPFSAENVKKVTQKTKNRIEFTEKNPQLKFQDYHILWIIREQIARIALTGITGFDSPVLEQSLEDAITNYESIFDFLKTYQDKFTSKELLKSWETEIQSTIKDLKTDFNTFNRYDFIKNHAHKQLELVNKTKKDWKVDFPYQLAFNSNINSFFTDSTFNRNFFADYKEHDSIFLLKKKLGKQLFNDKRLSKNNMMSCATCHIKSKAFTDGKKVFPKQKRNTPTVTYAGLQQAFFYDARTGNLEGQIVDVVNNVNEFHTNLKDFASTVSKDANYFKNFKKIYNGKITDQNVRNAIASYIRGLNTFDSKFDNNINGKENTLTENEINGFNIFMGKGKCATCHFPPTFNGTVPPNFTESELELLGTPHTKDKQNAVVDTDLGRYELFKTEERKHFFKTPSIRNIEKTAPYMHNGVYDSLEEVMEFYNIGGGAGLGIELEYQTLPPDSLNLSNQEINDVIAFMKTLTDKEFIK